MVEGLVPSGPPLLTNVSGGGMSSCWCYGLCRTLQHTALEETGACFGEVKTSVLLF